MKDNKIINFNNNNEKKISLENILKKRKKKGTNLN